MIVRLADGEPHEPPDDDVLAESAAVVVPKETLENVEKWFEKTQNDDGGWGYHRNGKRNASSGAMTTAGLTCVIVAKYYQGKDWRKAASVQKGLTWLGSNLVFDANPGGGKKWHYYYLYGLERVGVIFHLTATFTEEPWLDVAFDRIAVHHAADDIIYRRQIVHHVH